MRPEDEKNNLPGQEAAPPAENNEAAEAAADETTAAENTAADTEAAEQTEVPGDAAENEEDFSPRKSRPNARRGCAARI